MRHSRDSEAGMAPFFAIVLTAVGFFLIALVATLFATRLAQDRIWPMVQNRVDTAIHGLPFVGGDEVVEVSAPPERGRTPADSLQALLTQLETQRVFVETRSRQLARQRAEIDSVMAALQTIQSDEVKRQAKLYAAMKPDAAARILYSLDDETLVAVLKNMNARAASKVMGLLDPRRLARLSMEGIGRPQLATMDLSQAGTEP